MQSLTPHGQQVVADIAQRHGISQQAVETLLVAVNNGGGYQAQFSHPELGGMGQWSRGGMVMVGDMFNNGLKFTVDQVCTELSNALAQGQLFAPAPERPGYAGQGYSSQSQSQSSGGHGGASFMVQGGAGGAGWPAKLGPPSSTGSQNNLRYAVFPQTRRLAIDHGGRITVYDIGDHQIGGFSQQQGGDQSITFTSQHGTMRVADLPVVPLAEDEAPAPAMEPRPAPKPPEPQHSKEIPPPAAGRPPAPAPGPAEGGQAEIFSLIEKLADLHSKGILTDSEYETKKAELLSRL